MSHTLKVVGKGGESGWQPKNQRTAANRQTVVLSKDRNGRFQEDWYAAKASGYIWELFLLNNYKGISYSFYYYKFLSNLYHLLIKNKSMSLVFAFHYTFI